MEEKREEERKKNERREKREKDSEFWIGDWMDAVSANTSLWAAFVWWGGVKRMWEGEEGGPGRREGRREEGSGEEARCG